MTTQSFVRRSSKTRLRPVLWEKGSSAGLNHDSSHRFTDYGRHLVFPELAHFVTDDPTLTCPLPDRLCASRGHDSSHRINDTIAQTYNTDAFGLFSYLTTSPSVVHSILLSLASTCKSRLTSALISFQ